MGEGMGEGVSGHAKVAMGAILAVAVCELRCALFKTNPPPLGSPIIFLIWCSMKLWPFTCTVIHSMPSRSNGGRYCDSSSSSSGWWWCDTTKKEEKKKQEEEEEEDQTVSIHDLSAMSYATRRDTETETRGVFAHRYLEVQNVALARRIVHFFLLRSSASAC